MTDLPIMFNAPMVRALVQERKTQTRRLGNRKFKIGDRLYVRETLYYKWDWKSWLYRADDVGVNAIRHQTLPTPPDYMYPTAIRSSLLMPRCLSRLTLLVTKVTQEAVADIGDEGIKNEGFENLDEFKALWMKMHGPESFSRNPIVTVITFEVRQANIDEG